MFDFVFSSSQNSNIDNICWILTRFHQGLFKSLGLYNHAPFSCQRRNVGMSSGHCHSLLLVIIKRTSLVTEFDEVCLSIFDGVYINPNVDLQYWKGRYIHYFFFLPNEKLFDLPPPLNFKYKVCSLKDACSEGTNITDELQYIMARISNFGQIIMRHLVQDWLAVSSKTPGRSQLYFHTCGSSNLGGCFWRR